MFPAFLRATFYRARSSFKTSVYSTTFLRRLMGFRLFNDCLINEITLTALGVRWGWEIIKSSKPAKYNDKGDTAISKFLMETKNINYHSIGFSVSTKSKLCDTISYDSMYITVLISSFRSLP